MVSRSARARRESTELSDSRTAPMAYLKTAHQCLINGHHGARIVEFAAVVRRREQRHQLTFGKELVAIFHDLNER